MPGKGFEKIGVEAVVEGLSGFNKAIGQVEKSVEQASKAVQRATDSTAQVGRGAESAVGGITSLSGAMIALGAAAAVVAVGVGVATIAVKGLLDLAEAGAGIRGIEQSFEAMTDAIMRSTDASKMAKEATDVHGTAVHDLSGMLEEMRAASKGTISDLVLMQRANIALAGTSGELSVKFAKALPKFLEIARVQAVATGHSVDYLYNSLVLGIKRSEPRLIDNTGLIIKVGQATERYAQSIGKTVEQLTAQERQMAVLEETLRVGEQQLAIYGNVQETAAIKAERMHATLANIGNTIAESLQPGYEALIDGINEVLGFISTVVDAAAPFIQGLSDLFADLLQSVFGDIMESLNALNAGEFVQGFFTGGARMIGALAGGMASAANKYVLPVIKGIAQMIASFLSGFSPPPEGPLSTIDIGGSRVMEAWLAGFLGVSMDPVEKVAGEVAMMMGSIGTASREVVEARLRALDEALKPFQNRLAIVRAQFDALKPTVDAAFSAIDRQLEKSLILLNKGAEGSGAMVRHLDRQRESLEGFLDAQQAAVDAAQIQLSLAESQQAVERAMLKIRLDQLGPVEKAAKAVREAAGPKPKKPKEGGGGGEKPQETGGEGLKGGGGAGLPGGLSSAADAVAAASAKGQMVDAATEGFLDAGGDLNETLNQIDEIGEAGASIKGSLSKIGDKIQKAFSDAFNAPGPDLIAKMGTFLDQLLAEFGAQLLIKFGVDLPNLLQKIIGDAFAGLAPAAIDIGIVFTQAWADIKSGAETGWANISNTITVWWDSIRLNVQTRIENLIFDLSTAWTNIRLEVERVWNAIWLWITTQAENIWHDLTNTFTNLSTDLGITLDGIRIFFEDAWNGIIKFVSSVIAQVSKVFTDISNAIVTALGPASEIIQKILSGIGAIAGSAFVPGGDAIQQAINNAKAGKTGKKATGGIFRKGETHLIGEEGPEFLTFGADGFILSNAVVKALSRASDVLAHPAPVPIHMGTGGSSNHSVNNNNQTVNMNGVPGMDDAIRRYALLRAIGRM